MFHLDEHAVTLPPFIAFTSHPLCAHRHFNMSYVDISEPDSTTYAPPALPSVTMLIGIDIHHKKCQQS